MNQDLQIHFNALDTDEIVRILNYEKVNYTEDAIRCMEDILKKRIPEADSINLDGVEKMLAGKSKLERARQEIIDENTINEQKVSCNVCKSPEISIRIPIYAGKKGKIDFLHTGASVLTNALIAAVSIPLTGGTLGILRVGRKYDQMLRIDFLLCDPCAKNFAKPQTFSERVKVKMEIVVKYNLLIRKLNEDYGFSLFDETEYEELFGND